MDRNRRLHPRQNRQTLFTYFRDSILGTRGLNFFQTDLNLQRVLERLDGEMLKRNAVPLGAFGAWVGSELDMQASYSDRYAPPILETHNKLGEKKSRLIFNSQYEKCHREAYERGVVGLAFQDKDPEPHLLSFTMGYLLAQADIAVHCPVTMTGAVAYVLSKYAPQPVKDEFLPQLTRMDGQGKSGGTWCTELQGGSDVGATTTRAVHENGKIRLYGLKWFTSNANSGLALATARPEDASGLSAGGGKGAWTLSCAEPSQRRFRQRLFYSPPERQARHERASNRRDRPRRGRSYRNRGAAQWSQDHDGSA
jgi:acyl-CoA dehydrogenase